jgi:hypothetical protein
MTLPRQNEAAMLSQKYGDWVWVRFEEGKAVLSQRPPRHNFKTSPDVRWGGRLVGYGVRGRQVVLLWRRGR